MWYNQRAFYTNIDIFVRISTFICFKFLKSVSLLFFIIKENRTQLTWFGKSSNWTILSNLHLWSSENDSHFRPVKTNVLCQNFKISNGRKANKSKVTFLRFSCSSENTNDGTTIFRHNILGWWDLCLTPFVNYIYNYLIK